MCSPETAESGCLEKRATSIAMFPSLQKALKVNKRELLLGFAS